MIRIKYAFCTNHDLWKWISQKKGDKIAMLKNPQKGDGHEENNFLKMTFDKEKVIGFRRIRLDIGPEDAVEKLLGKGYKLILVQIEDRKTHTEPVAYLVKLE